MKSFYLSILIIFLFASSSFGQMNLIPEDYTFANSNTDFIHEAHQKYERRDFRNSLKLYDYSLQQDAFCFSAMIMQGLIYLRIQEEGGQEKLKDAKKAISRYKNSHNAKAHLTFPREKLQEVIDGKLGITLTDDDNKLIQKLIKKIDKIS